jgi:hypothetical protein
MGIVSNAEYAGTRGGGPTDPTIPHAPAIATEGTRVEQCYAAMVHADKRHAEHVQNVNTVAGRECSPLTDDGKVEAFRRFEQTPAARAIGEHMAAVDDYVQATEAEAQRIRDGLRPGDSVADQLAAQRKWSRIKGKLDAADDGTVTSVAQRVIETASLEELPTVAEELPDYLEGRNVPGEFVDDLLGQRVEEYGQARDRVRLAHKQRAILQHDAAKLHRQIHEGHRSEVPLVDPRNVTAQRYA